MKMKFSLLSACLMLLATGSWNVVWGQYTPPVDNNGGSPPWNDPFTSWYDVSKTISNGSFSLNNNFGPGEEGIIYPLSSGNSQNAGTHSLMGVIYNPFDTDNGIITVGGTHNVIENLSNVASVSDGCSYNVYSDQYRYNCGGGYVLGPYTGGHSVFITAPGAPAIPDGNGQVTIGSVPTGPQGVTAHTKITVDATSKSSDTPWFLQQFYFLDNPWYYNKYTLEKGGTISHYLTGTCYLEHWECISNCTGGGTPSYGWVPTFIPVTNIGCSHQGVRYNGTTVLGGTYIPASIILLAGSHVRLDGTHNSLSIGAGAHSNIH